MVRLACRTVSLAVVALLLCAGSAVAASTTTQSASGSGVTASFSYTGSGINVHGAHLTIARNGQTVYDQPVRSPACGSRCGPGAFGRHVKSVRVLRLDPGRFDVILELYTGGANCCLVDQVFTYAPAAGTYVKTERNFASYGAAIRRLGSARRWRFLSGDDSFKYEFTDGADSGEPIQIFSFSATRFHNVTRSYPTLIASDARRWWKYFTSHLSNGVGLIAAWAADQELLGHDKHVQSTLATEARRGNLRDGGLGGPTGRRFIAALDRFLHKLGYRK
jgi:hypothetical protein